MIEQNYDNKVMRAAMRAADFAQLRSTFGTLKWNIMQNQPNHTNLDIEKFIFFFPFHRDYSLS